MQPEKANKINSIDLSQLPVLTEKQEKFARGLLEGLSASDAYRAAYDCSNSEDCTIWGNASRLKTDSRVLAWLKAARIAGLEQGVLSHMQFVNRLLELSAKAEEAGAYGAAIQAMTNAGKAAGHMVERYEDMTPIERKDARIKLQEMAAKADSAFMQANDDKPEIMRH